MKKRFAAVDIGTNTILMLIAEINDDGSFSVIRDEHNIARLGEDLNNSGNIGLPAVERAAKILNDYKHICLFENVSYTNVSATSALRDARNSSSVLSELNKYTDSPIEIISGETEAALSCLGTVEDNSASLVIDIGGGSTEFVFTEDGKINQRHSLQIGAVRLTEHFFNKEHPPSLDSISRFRKYITSALENTITLSFYNKIYAVAGTPTTVSQVAQQLIDFDDSKINGHILSRSMISDILDIFTVNELPYLIEKLHIHPKRADVITAGTIILLESLRFLNASECIVSTKGLRYGLLKSMINKI